jgi:uncharacterized protein (DUF433 family)
MKFEAPFDRITAEENKLVGKPCIRGIRISVVCVLNCLAAYPNRADLFENYPSLEEKDISQALHFAATALENMRMPTQSVDEDGEPVITFKPINPLTFLESLE